jgi:branched-chain amino acid transport system permease protein
VSGLDRTFDMLLYAIVGGLGTIAGPLIGTLLLAVISQLIQGFAQYQMLVYGPLLVILVMFFPGGIVGAFNASRKRLVQSAANTPALTPEARLN